MLSRKVEGLDPVKPWQPFIKKLKKVLISTAIKNLFNDIRKITKR